MFWGKEISSEEEERKIQEVAELIHKYEMETIAIFVLQTSRPMVFVGGELGRAFTSPLFMLLGDKLIDQGDTFFSVFEKRENIDKLVDLLKKTEQENKNTEKAKNEKIEENTEKKGWRKYLPF